MQAFASPPLYSSLSSNKPLLEKTSRARVEYSWQWLLWILLGTGMLLRLFQFFDNRSLWLDETYLANSLIRLDFLQLARPEIEFEQKAPLGFLWLCRGAVLLFGKKEMALRLVPLLAGLASLWLFAPVARYFLRPVGAAAAMGILALAPAFVYHSVEAKQYSTELLATVVVLWLYTRYQARTDWQSLLLWGFWGGIVVWFSYSCIFVLLGMAAAVSLVHLFRKDWRLFLRYALPFALWGLSFIINYVFFTGKHADSPWLVFWFRKVVDGFMPHSLAGVRWTLYQLYMLQEFPLNLLWDLNTLGSKLPRLLFRILPLTCGLAGLLLFFYHNKKTFLLLVLPIVLTLGASALEKYPFFERLTVFLGPLLIILLARGFEALTRFMPTPGRYVLFILLLAPPFVASARQVVDTRLFGGYKKSYYREELLYVNDHYQPGEVVYVYWNHIPAYRYYKEAYQLKYTGVLGRDFRSVSTSVPTYLHNVSQDFDATVGKRRGWLLCNDETNTIGDFVGTPAWFYLSKADYGTRLRTTIAKRRTLKFAFRKKKTDAYLFDSPQEGTAGQE